MNHEVRGRDRSFDFDEDSFVGLLLSDLERHYHYGGQSGRRPRIRELWRSFLVPRCAPVALYRVAHRLHLRGLRWMSKAVTWLNFYLHGVEISARCDIGAYFYMPHVAGAVIGATSIGRYAVIYHQVTLGATNVSFGDEGRPSVGDCVVIGSGAKVLGAISIGDSCRIGANCVVVESLPPNTLVVAPSRIILKERTKAC